jgi:hypothetical protein
MRKRSKGREENETEVEEKRTKEEKKKEMIVSGGLC